MNSLKQKKAPGILNLDSQLSLFLYAKLKTIVIFEGRM